MPSKMNTHMLSIECEMFELLLKRLKEAVKTGDEKQVLSLLRRIGALTVQSREWLPADENTVNGTGIALEVASEHDLHYSSH